MKSYKYLNVINQHHNILRHVEITEIKNDRVANYSLAQDSINLLRKKTSINLFFKTFIRAKCQNVIKYA